MGGELAIFLLLAAAPGFEDSFRTGLLALQRDDLKTAETSLSAAIKLEPKNGRAWVALAQTYRKLNQIARANDAASRAAALSPQDRLVYSSLVIFYSQSNQPWMAAEAQARYVALVPGDSAAREKAEELYFAAVQPLLQQEKFAEAIDLLGPARQDLPGSAQLELALGVAYYGLRRFDEAAGAFLGTIAIAPELEQPYLFLGKFLNQIPGRLPEVTARFLQYQIANPANYAGYLLHAKALNAQSVESQAARKLLEKAISINGSDASSHFELGSVLDRLQQYDGAAGEYERAAFLDPTEAATHYRLARIYDRLGKPDEARRERERHAKLISAQQAPI